MRVLFFVICIISVGSVKKLPIYIKQCYKTPSSDLSKCVVDNIYNLRSKLRDGIPELLVPSLNPLIISSANLTPSDSFSSQLNDIKLWNVENMNITNFVMELEDDKKWDLHMEYDSLFLQSNFHMKGKLLVFDLDSQGLCSANFSGVKIMWSGDLDTVIKNGKEHLHIKSSVIKVSIDSGSFHFEDLFKNNNELNERANKVFNENFKVFLDEFGPLIENVIKTFATQSFNGIYNKYPIDVLFLKRV